MTTLQELLHPSQIHTSTPTTPALTRLGQAALAYAQLGWRVFPLAPRSKRPLRSPSFYEATWDAATLRAWWSTAGRCNIGLATGAGLIALDFDPAHGAGPWWQEHGPALRHTVAARSGNGGWHLLLRVPPACAIRNSSSKLAPGVDVRGDGGYLVVAPSVHPLGRPYRWVRGQSPWDCALAPLPDALIHTLTRAGPARPPPRPSPTIPTATPTAIPTGQRNTTLTSLAGTMRRRNFSPTAISAALLIENGTRCRPPLPEPEVLRIVRNICRYPPG